jgi:hypothetical protein
VRTQLRPFHDADALAKIYDHPYDHTAWAEHRQRVEWTVRAGIALVEHLQAVSLVDLSCGDGAVLRGIQAGVKHETKLTFGDLVRADHIDLIGPIENSIMHFNVVSGVDGRMLVLTETIEHLEDPDKILRIAREAFSSLLVTTPIDETVAHGNQEHYWGWSVADVDEMLTVAGWRHDVHHRLDATFYSYQLWGCH